MSLLKGTYKIIKEHNVIIMSYTGIVTLENYVALKMKMINDKDYLTSYNYIEDYSDLVFNVTDEDVKAYVEFATTYENYKRQTALITNTPNNVIIGYMYDLYKDGRISKIEVVSTLASALKWCNIDLQFLPFFENELVLLKDSCK